MFTYIVHAMFSLALAQSKNVQNTALQMPIEEDTPIFIEDFKPGFGLQYFSFFNGPGITHETLNYTPNALGKPDNFGLGLQNQISLTWKFNPRWALDLQFRFDLNFNNPFRQEEFTVLKWQTPRIGISGLLLGGEDWELRGAINTDFPYVLPEPLTGFQARARTTLLALGTFAQFKYTPKYSPWSLFVVVAPRVFLYADRNASEKRLSDSGLDAVNKPDIILALKPTINYQFNTNLALSVGTSIDYRKQVVSGWNPFYASLKLNGSSKAWRLDGFPVFMGLTYKISPLITIFPYIAAYPLEEQRRDAKTQKITPFFQTIFVGGWIRGTLI